MNMNLIKHTLLIKILFVSSQIKAKEPEGKKDAISFSRFEWWNREKKAYTPTNPDNHTIYAIQAINAITQFEDFYKTRK